MVQDRDIIKLKSRSNMKTYVACRMAPISMTLSDPEAGVKFSGSWWELGSHTSHLSSHTLHTGSHISRAGSHTLLSSSHTSVYTFQTNVQLCNYSYIKQVKIVNVQPEPAGCSRSWTASVATGLVNFGLVRHYFRSVSTTQFHQVLCHFSYVKIKCSLSNAYTQRTVTSGDLAR